jgi:hypothetical protein
MTLFLDLDRTLFDTERFYEAMERSLLLQPLYLAKIARLREFLYPDAIPFLQAHASDDLVLVTRGIPALQRLKAEKSGVLAHIPHALYVAEGTKARAIRGHIARNPLRGPAYFLDDLPEELYAVREELPDIRVVRVRRPVTRTSGLPSPGLPEVRDLLDFGRYATAEGAERLS